MNNIELITLEELNQLDLPLDLYEDDLVLQDMIEIKLNQAIKEYVKNK